MTRLPATIDQIIASAGRVLSRDDATAAAIRDDFDRMARILAEIRDSERETAAAMDRLAAAVAPFAFFRK